MRSTAPRLTPTRRRLRLVRQARPLRTRPDWSIDWKRDRWGVLTIAVLFFLFVLALELAPWL